jgi:hypothetical protein
MQMAYASEASSMVYAVGNEEHVIVSKVLMEVLSEVNDG